MANFKEIADLVLNVEKGFSNEPWDNGGPTKYGVTIGTLSTWRRKRCTVDDVKNLTLDEAYEIYREKFWVPIHGDELPFAIALLTFDSAINSGPAQAARWLQRACGVVDDGVIGPKTLAAAKAYDVRLLSKEMVAQRLLFLASLPDFKQAGLGWFRRVSEKLIESMTHSS